MRKMGSLLMTGCMLATMLTMSAVGAHAEGYTSKTGSNAATTTKPILANTYYVSPVGNDHNPGTKSSPFRTLMKAQSVASSGDIVYIRGNAGDFELTDADVAKTDDTYHYVNDFTKSGITYEAYPGDPRPVFDFSGVSTDRRVAAFFIDPSAQDLTFKGFDVIGTKAGDQKQSENFNIRGNVFIDDVAAHDSEANGFYVNVHGSGTVINSDAYNNLGPTAANAGNTDGFGGHGDNVAFINDRSWHNSDDGFDSINSWGHVIYDHDWSFNNRGNNDGIGDKNGFKVGGYAYEVNTSTKQYIPDQLPVHSVEYCLSVNNGANGFYANHMPGQSANWTNNTAYGNSHAQFDMLERVSPTDINNIAGYREVLHNNIAYGGTLTADDNTPAENETNNSWTINGGLTLTDNDFKSLDTSQLSAPRKSDGSLPDVTFMQPVASSPLSQYGLGYLADKKDPTESLQQLVSVYTQYGNIDNAGIENSLNKKLQNHDLHAFLNELTAQSGKHIDKDTTRVLTIEAQAIMNQES
ncbi:pectate lyase [Pullulanibacillus sp. KACC 23026]|uniref:right-handed parallel beta-helix repeat-containing protein n=1 Tax=Pullulanibacillus sp. KACC 23026 TaxID=3028315 RepID=UPI0023B08BC0|nr:pectate lyase [Pullulanibacillus sp. KACC 23026]WEG12421.1 pectate lyase [Pullulanibacillus sp. KACC 23026]